MKPYLITFKCPYCGAENEARFSHEEMLNNIVKVMRCELETGGCEEDFVVKMKSTFSYEAQVFELQKVV